MIKDTFFKALSIPVLGVLIPLLSGLIQYQRFSGTEIIFSNGLFVAVSFLIWEGSVLIVSFVRRLQLVKQRIFLKIAMMCLMTSVYAFAVSYASGLLWQRIFLSAIETRPIFYTGIICISVVIFLTLLYEVLFLSKERELDIKIVDQLDKERVDAELNSLKGELDPHFIFNSLATLAHLISLDTDKAQMFTNKLARVYKYFLINKDRELISLADELKFIDDYTYLLRIRYDDRIDINFNIGETEKIMVIPCALQVLVENAIKHNQFTEANPLNLCISLNAECLKVENNIKEKDVVNSTKIGLTNLSNRYRLIYNKDIAIEKTDNKFIVKLPLIKQNSL
jgi:two-component system, LytTR family, sensor kinase